MAISNDAARQLLLERYGLLTSPRRRLTRQGLLELIGQLGFVQIDSISTIERAHHMILAARADGYRRADLWRLVERDRQLFENWTHDAALLPMSNYRYWQPRFQRSRDRLLKRWRQWREAGFEERFDAILERVRRDGPVKARELAPPRQRKSTGWWDWHPDKSALEFLWRTGELAVTRREGFQKVYDLTERVVPEVHRAGKVDHAAMIDWACASALERLGYGTAGDIAGFWDSVSPAEAKAWLARQPSSRIVPVSVETCEPGRTREAFALADGIEDWLAKADAQAPPSRLRILNPFDPLIRDRKRLEQIFGFDYRIEVFVPEAKRRYGYYVCPILEGTRLTGRIDMRHRREHGGLVVTRLWWEPGIASTKGRRNRLAAELERWRKFIDADAVIFENGYDDR